jgi:hypothetical protein
VIVKGLKKYSIFNATNGTDDDTLWNGSKDNENVSSECEEDEGTDCEDGHTTDNAGGKSAVVKEDNLTYFVY